MNRILLAGVLASLPLSALPLTTPQAAADAGAGQTAVAPADERQSPPQGSLRASDLIDRDIETPQGETLGEIQDVIVSTGGAAYAIFNVGGFLGIGDHAIAVPLDQLQVGDERVVYDTTREALSAHPRYYFPDAPVSGSSRPGPERSQEARGEGDPRKAAEHNLAAQRIAGEGERSSALEDGDPGLPDDTLAADVPWSQRQAYLDQASRAVDQWTLRAQSAKGLDDKAEQDLQRYAEALRSRYASLQQASQANWTELRNNFAAQLGKVRDTLADASGGAAGPASGGASQNAERP